MLSLNNEVEGSVGSTIATVFGASNETSETGVLSRALATGRTVAIRSIAAVTPQIATDFVVNFFIASFMATAPFLSRLTRR
jgi:hypothetical protein